MNHADRIGVIISELDGSLDTGDMVDAIEEAMTALQQIKDEIDAKDELLG